MAVASVSFTLVGDVASVGVPSSELEVFFVTFLAGVAFSELVMGASLLAGFAVSLLLVSFLQDKVSSSLLIGVGLLLGVAVSFLDTFVDLLLEGVLSSLQALVAKSVLVRLVDSLVLCVVTPVLTSGSLI